MKKILLTTTLCAAIASASAAPRVVSSIYPLQQIANAIVGQPTGLINDSYLSPHDYAIKPNDAKTISEADIVLWVRAGLISQLDKYISRRGEDQTTLTALELPNMKLLKSDHKHDHHHGHDGHDEHEEHHDGHDEHEEHHDGHDKHEEHHDGHDEHEEHHDGHDEHEEHHDGHDEHEEHHDGHDKHEEHHDDHDKHEEHHDGHDEHEEHHDGHDEHEEHHDGHDKHEDFGYDPHVWLSTHNAGVIAKALATNLSRLDPANKAQYEKNLQVFLTDLQKTKSDVINNFKINPPSGYFVFHNAYAYFEDEFGVKHKGVVTMHGGQAPKAGVLAKLKKQLENTANACLFREPQFDSKIVKRLAEGTGAKIAVLNPIGYVKDKNIGYTTIIRNIANQISTCGESKK